MPRKGKDFARKSKIVNNDDSSVSVNNSDLIDKSIDNLITSNKDASSLLVVFSFHHQLLVQLLYLPMLMIVRFLVHQMLLLLAIV